MTIASMVTKIWEI